MRCNPDFGDFVQGMATKVTEGINSNGATSGSNGTSGEAGTNFDTGTRGSKGTTSRAGSKGADETIKIASVGSSIPYVGATAAISQTFSERPATLGSIVDRTGMDRRSDLSLSTRNWAGVDDGALQQKALRRADNQPRIKFYKYDIALQSASALFIGRMIGSSSVCPRNQNSAKP